MDTSSISQVDRRTRLKGQLKKWEHDFASQNGGRRPSRDDIRQNSKIASKYREYHKLRHQEKDSDDTVPVNDETHVTESSSSLSLTVDSQLKKTGKIANKLKRFLNTERIKATPQKNGKVLGIFDSVVCPPLSPETPASPCRANRKTNSPGCIISASDENITMSTPSKAYVGRSDIHSENLATPSKKRIRSNSTHEIETSRPNLVIRGGNSSAYHDDFTTPKALRHNRLCASVSTDSPDKLFLPTLLARGPRLKGLTSMLEELRKTEDEMFVDDEEAIRSVGTDHVDHGRSHSPTCMIDGESAPNSKSREHRDPETKKERFSDMIPRTGAEGESINSPLAPEHQSPVVWKRKGLKRQTRRSILRPISTATNSSASHDATKSQSKKRRIKPIANFQKLKLRNAGSARQKWSRMRHRS